MTVRGRKPKPSGEALNRNALEHPWVEVLNVPFEGGPELPKARAGGQYWPEWTREKWDAWRRMPHARLWGPEEWSYALDAIEIAGSFHRTGDTKYAAELRNREKVLGTTAHYRRDLRIRYIDPPDLLCTDRKRHRAMPSKLMREDANDSA